MIEIIDLLAEVWNKFLKLEKQHECDDDEFMKGIHDCQKIIMIRETRRNDPNRFLIGKRYE